MIIMLFGIQVLSIVITIAAIIIVVMHSIRKKLLYFYRLETDSYFVIVFASLAIGFL